jgi:magnesium transporter
VFRVLDLPASGKPIVQPGLDHVAPPPGDTIRWIDLVEPDAGGLALLRERFGFHPLAIEDCAAYGLQSKLDDYEGYLFVVVHAFTASPDDPLSIQIHEIHAFLGESYLVTVHDNPLPAQEHVWERALADANVMDRGPSWLLYLTADTMVDASVPLVERILDQIDEIEREAIEGGSSRLDLTPVFRIKRTTVAMRRVIRPLRDTIAILSRRNDERVSPRTVLHMRDVADHVGRLAEMVEECREVCGNVVSAYQATQAAHANEVMKKLTIFSAVFLPLSFIVGFFGQNFIDLPYDNNAVLALMLASMVILPAGLLEWFRKNWLT